MQHNNSDSNDVILKGAGHFLAAIITMGIYGGQVCPMVETLSLSSWFLELTVIFALFFVLRIILYNWIMKTHTTLGVEALRGAAAHLEANNFLQVAQDLICSHHEKWDGKGYPHGLRGESIPLVGRIMAVADVYDALICERIYKEAFSHEKAKSIIVDGKGTHFDPNIVDAFLAIEQRFVEISRKFADG